MCVNVVSWDCICYIWVIKMCVVVIFFFVVGLYFGFGVNCRDYMILMMLVWKEVYDLIVIIVYVVGDCVIVVMFVSLLLLLLFFEFVWIL